MINSINVLSTKGVNKDIPYSDSDWHNYKLYPFLLQEALYMVGSKDNSVYPEIASKNKSNNQVSFIKIKRLVKAIRYEGYTHNTSIPLKNTHRKIPSRQRKKCLDKLIVQAMTMVLDNVNQKSPSIVKNNIYLQKFNAYNSVHSALLAIEYQWQCYTSIFEGRVPSFLHPEIVIRILRNKMQDVSFIHLLRQLLHQNVITLDPPNTFLRESYSNKLGLFLLNLYTVEVDKFFLLEIPRFLKNNKSCNTFDRDDISCLKKINIWNPILLSTQTLSRQGSILLDTKIYTLKDQRLYTLYGTDAIMYKYIRNKNIWFLNIQAKKEIINILEKRYLKFLQNRIGCIYQSKPVKSILVENSVLFLGYIIQFKVKDLFVRIYRDSSILRNVFKIKTIDVLNPLFLIVRILATYRFCTYFGYPISKSGWATWSDTTIIERFKRIRDSLIGYYSGSINQKDLSRIHHILHYSCAKTLACKHKTNLRKIWKKYGNNLSIQYKSHKSRTYFHMVGTTRNGDSRRNLRLWNLHIKQPDPMSILLENTYRSQKKVAN